MTATFCMPFKKKFGIHAATFKSTDGEVHVFKYATYIEPLKEMNIHLNWQYSSSKYIRLSFYNVENAMTSSKTLFVEDKYSVESIVKIQSPIKFIVVKIVPVVHFEEHDLQPQEKPSDQNKISVAEKPITKTKTDRLLRDMKNLLQRGTLSDIVLTDGLVEISAHKNILSARSAVFEKMFQNPMKENLENRIVIEDISIDLLKELLNFMYTGAVTIKDSKMARELYMAADKYDIKDLKNICSDLLKSVHMDSVLDTLLLADLYDDKLLKHVALSFICQNYSHLKSLRDWDTFMKVNQSLTNEILNFVINKLIKT